MVSWENCVHSKATCAALVILQFHCGIAVTIRDIANVFHMMHVFVCMKVTYLHHPKYIPAPSKNITVQHGWHLHSCLPQMISKTAPVVVQQLQQLDSHIEHVYKWSTTHELQTPLLLWNFSSAMVGWYSIPAQWRFHASAFGEITSCRWASAVGVVLKKKTVWRLLWS